MYSVLNCILLNCVELWYIEYDLLDMIYCIWFIVYGLLYMVYDIKYIVYTIQV